VAALNSATQIIRDAKKDWERVVVVTSAMSGVTNLLLNLLRSPHKGRPIHFSSRIHAEGKTLCCRDA